LQFATSGGWSGHLADDVARPVIYYLVSGACCQHYFKSQTMMVNGNHNSWRLEDAWLDK
jgi:hypothetical protein